MGGDVEVLHVDNDEAFTDVTKRCLEDEGEQFSVTTATSVSDGLEILAERSIDCVVADHDMPESSGIEFLTRVRDRSPDLPFILFTGKGSESIASEAITAGVTDYLQKESGTSQYAILANRIENAVTQRRAQKEAKQTRRRLTEVTENIPDCVWMFDREWEELLFISGYEEVWNRSEEALREDPQSFLEGVVSEDRQFVRENMEKLSSGEPTDIEYRINRDGDIRWVWVKGSPITDEHGAVDRVVGFTRDITERKTQQQELEELSHRYQAYVENTQDIITVLDETGEIVYQSAAVERVLGYSPEELVGRDAFSYIHPDDREEVVSNFTMVVDGSAETAKSEFRFEDKTGSWVWIESIASEHSDADIDGYLVNSRDITDRKEYETRLKQQNEQLEEFAGVVSHDLRNPLNTATARLTLAREECETDHHEPIERALDRMERIIEDVLWLALNGQELGDPEPVKVRSAVESAWELVADGDADPSLEFTGEKPPDGRLVADRDRLRHLLENLLGNAVEHAGPSVDIRVELTEDQVAIADDGPGIPPADRSEVFEAGYSTTQGGTGFGLRIVEQVVDAHGWELTVTDSADDGARFEISDIEIRPPPED